MALCCYLLVYNHFTFSRIVMAEVINDHLRTEDDTWQWLQCHALSGEGMTRVPGCEVGGRVAVTIAFLTDGSPLVAACCEVSRCTELAG